MWLCLSLEIDSGGNGGANHSPGYLLLLTDRREYLRHSSKTPPALRLAEVFDLSFHFEVIHYRSEKSQWFTKKKKYAIALLLGNLKQVLKRQTLESKAEENSFYCEGGLIKIGNT